MHFLQACNEHEKKCNIAHILCVLCNFLSARIAGAMKRLYNIHSNLAGLCDGVPKLWLETRQQNNSIEIRGPLASTKEHQNYNAVQNA